MSFAIAALMTSTISVGLVVLIFGLFAPWYRTWAGCTLFGVKVSFFMLLVTLSLDVAGQSPWLVHILLLIALPLATVTSLALLVLMVLTQLVRTGKTAGILFNRNIIQYTEESK